MKEIIFKESNFDKINEELQNVQKYSRTRTISLKDITECLELVLKRLDIPKKYMDGIKVYIDKNAQDFPNAYKYTPESTWFDAYYKNGFWRITDIYRNKTQRMYRGINLVLTEEAKNKIIEKYKYIY